MKRTLKATVRNGWLVLDEPCPLPEGSRVEFVPLDAELTPEELAELRTAWERGKAQGWIPASNVIDRLRK